MIWAEIGTGIAVLALVYAFLWNFKTDIKESIKDLSARMDRTDDRITSLEERMFLMATGKTLTEAILEERIRRGLNK
jgi:cell division protein FtsB